MIEIDGSEGGGQMLRTALSLSVLTDTPFTIDHIRGERPDPGLKRQHLECVNVMQRLSDADVRGDRIDSSSIVFKPGAFEPQDVSIDIQTAGSISLLFQTVMPLCYVTDDAFTVKAVGGTDVKWAPPVDYLRKISLPLLDNFGANCGLKVGRRGFYPEGGGQAGLTVRPADEEAGFITERGELQQIGGISIASQHLRDSSVAERQRSEARRVIKEELPSEQLDIDTRYVQSMSPGSSIILVAAFARTRIAGTCLGEQGKRSEKVGSEAADDLLSTYRSLGAVDPYMADQVVPYLGICGGKVNIPEMTDHVETNISVVESFVDVDVRRKDKGEAVELRVKR